MDQFVDDFMIEARQRSEVAVDDGHLHAQRGEHRRVLDADDPGTDNRHRARKPVEAEHRVRCRNDSLGVLHSPWLTRHGADGDQHLRR